MNYHNFSKTGNYFQLVRWFDGIAQVLTDKLNQFTEQEFGPDNMFMFGFSFGAQLVLEAGRRFGPQLIGRIDCKKKKILVSIQCTKHIRYILYSL